MWKESLPKGCPLKSTSNIDGLVVFRLVKSLTPKNSDFECHWNIKPKNRNIYQKTPHTHCVSMGVSVYESCEAALIALDLPSLRGAFKYIASLELKNTDGVISVFDKMTGHGTLWLYAGTNLSKNVVKVE